MSDERFDGVLGRVIDRWCDLDGDTQGVLVASAIVVLVWLLGADVR